MKMDSTLIPQIKHGIMDEDEDSLGSFTSSSSSSSSSELTEDTASSETSSSSSSSASSSPENPCKGPLFELSSLKEQLPFKRGLSKFYEGKSQSFTSISAVRRLEDLVKPERPLKRLKMSRSCGGGLDSQRTSSPGLRYCSSSSKRTIMKKSSSSSISGGRRNCFLLLGSKPPLYPQRPSNLSDQALWFA